MGILSVFVKRQFYSLGEEMIASWMKILYLETLMIP